MTYYQYGPAVQTAAYNVTLITTISGLTPGQLYALLSTGGPWHAPFGSFYNAQLHGGTIVLLDEVADGTGHNRIFFIPSGTTVDCSVADGGGPYLDNTGSLSWELYLALNDASPSDVSGQLDALAATMNTCCAEILAAVRRTFL